MAEADKLQGLRLNGQIPGLNEISSATGQLAGLNLLGAASASNWAIAPQRSRSRSGKSLLASDSHGPLGMPGLWSPVQIRAPKYQAAGVSVAGIPMILAGFNGKVAWSMTSVLGDNQDLFLKNPTPGQQPVLRGQRQMAASDRAQRNLLHQRPATDS